MKVEITPIQPFAERTTTKGVRLTALCTSGDDVLLVTYPAGATTPPQGKPAVVGGFFLPPRRAGDQPRLFVR